MSVKIVLYMMTALRTTAAQFLLFTLLQLIDRTIRLANIFAVS